MNMKEILKQGFFAGALVAAVWLSFLVSSISLVVGCTAIPREDADRLLAKIEKELDRHSEQTSETASTSDAAANPPAADTTADGGQSAGSAASGTLVFKYGGFDGSRAVEDPNTQISDLHMTKSGMRYKWAKGDLGNWGLAKTDAGAIACAGYWDGKQWIMAKFDWVSTSRTTRDFKNIYDHYNGWQPEPFFAAPKRAFCIISKDGKRRTNLIETEEP